MKRFFICYTTAFLSLGKWYVCMYEYAVYIYVCIWATGGACPLNRSFFFNLPHLHFWTGGGGQKEDESEINDCARRICVEAQVRDECANIQ